MSRFSVGEAVKVLNSYPIHHVRTPTFIRGRSGVIASISGDYLNPEERAYGQPGLPAWTLYRALFRQNEIWTNYHGPDQDTAVVDIYENWLKPTD